MLSPHCLASAHDGELTDAVFEILGDVGLDEDDTEDDFEPLDDYSSKQESSPLSDDAGRARESKAFEPLPPRLIPVIGGARAEARRAQTFRGECGKGRAASCPPRTRHQAATPQRHALSPDPIRRGQPTSLLTAVNDNGELALGSALHTSKDCDVVCSADSEAMLLPESVADLQCVTALSLCELEAESETHVPLHAGGIAQIGQLEFNQQEKTTVAVGAAVTLTSSVLESDVDMVPDMLLQPVDFIQSAASQVRIDAGSLPPPFGIFCVSSQGLQANKLLELPQSDLLLEASCGTAEIHVGLGFQPASFWSTLLPDEALRSTISHEHFEVSMEASGLRLKNLSLSGTRVNGRRVDAHVDILSGDLIEIGMDQDGGDAPVLAFRVSNAFGNLADLATHERRPGAQTLLMRHTHGSKVDPMMDDLVAVRSLPQIDVNTLVALECRMVTQQCATFVCTIS